MPTSIKITRATIDRKPRSAAIALRRRRRDRHAHLPAPARRSAATSCASRSRRRSTSSAPASTSSTIATDSGSKRLISSHLAPADARRVFPVWDEPALKATFALTVTVPRAYTAVSNMPVAREEPVGPNAKQISFMTDAENVELPRRADGGRARTDHRRRSTASTVSVVTTAGKREQGRFALHSAIDLLRYFNDYFGLKYPLPKLDLIAIPNGYVSAMENWGAITFSESYLLFDPRKDAGSARRGIFALIAHEIAHQWFGNLVTMTWWDNLWLNEGFATWMESKATERFHPRWQTWLNNYDEKQCAMRQDADGTAHPIQPAGHRQVRSLGDVRRHHLQQGRRHRAHARRLSGHGGVPRRRAQIRRRSRLRQHHARPTCGARSKPSPASR